MLKDLIKNTLHKFGFQIRRTTKLFAMEDVLRRCEERTLEINTVIDVGASNGSWTKKCMQYLPDSNYLLVEAQKPHKASLIEFKKNHPNADFVLAAAGKTDGTVYFDNSDLFSGLASERRLDDANIVVQSISLDQEIRRRNLKPPFLIKLDTHGFEIPILDGAENILKEAGLVIIEVYNFKLREGSPKFYEICQYMEGKGFSCVEIADLVLRKHDNALWQMDMFFIPSDSKVFSISSFA